MTKEDIVKPRNVVVCLCGLMLIALCSAQQMDEATALYDKGVQYLSAGEPFKALEAFEDAVARKPGFADAHCGRGDAYSKTSRYPLAIAAYSEAIKLQPGHAGALCGRGFAHYFAEQYDLARGSFAAAIKADVSKAEVIVDFLVRELEALNTSLKGSK